MGDLPPWFVTAEVSTWMLGALERLADDDALECISGGCCLALSEGVCCGLIEEPRLGCVLLASWFLDGKGRLRERERVSGAG